MVEYQQLTGIINGLQTKQRLDQALVKLFPKYSRSQIKSWILRGFVMVDGEIILIPRKKIIGSKHIEIRFLTKEYTPLQGQAISLDIIYEDEDILVINKQSNFVVHPGHNNNDGTVLNALLHYYPPIKNVPRAGIVHRLDKDTTGLMIIAKTLLAYNRLIQCLQKRKIIREYLAIAHGTMSSGGIIDKPIARHAVKRTHMTVHPMGKTAKTYYRIVECFHACTHLRLRLETGRTHQIRVHMHYIHHPLVGDPLYGIRHLQSSKIVVSDVFHKTLCNFNRQALHAIKLRFHHPITLTEMEYYAPIPPDIIMLMDALREKK